MTIPSTLEIGAAYIRVSTDDQTELSPDAQIRVILDAAKADGYIIPKEYIFEEKKGISGRKADNRPEFQRMIAIAKSQSPAPFKRLYLWKFSRFARNQEESTFYKGILRKKCGIDIKSVSEPIMEGMFGRLIETIIEWFDEYYSFNLSGEVTRGMTENALRGVYQCRPPLGYRIPYHKATPEIVPEEAKIIQTIFDKYVNEKMSIFAIVKYLNSLGLKTSHGKPFEKRSLEYILQNPGYAGDIRWNRTVNETNEIRDPSEWIIRPGHHPAIIDKELFMKAQERYNSEYQRRNGKPSEIAKHWLSGLLKCPSCGRSLSSCVVHRKTLPDTFSFQCYGYLKGKCSHNCYVKEKDIGPTVIKALEDVVRRGTVTYSVKQLRKNKSSNKELETLRKSLEKISLKEARAKEAYMDGIDTKDEYRNNKMKLQQEQQELERMIAELERSDPEETTNDSLMLGNISSVLDILRSPNFTMQEKNIALKSIVDRIVYYKDRNHIDAEYYLTETPENLLK